MLKKTALRAALTGGVLALACTFAVIPGSFAQAATDPQTGGQPPAVTSVDTSSRSSVDAAYQQLFLDSKVTPEWTGDVSQCLPGSTTQAYRLTMVHDINLVRQWAGLSGAVVQNSDITQTWGIQARALVAQANMKLTHSFTPDDACATQAFSALNITPDATGVFGPLANNAPGWDSNDLEVAAQSPTNGSMSNPVLDWMGDANNIGGVEPGHRLELLYPGLNTVAIGATSNFSYADATWSIPAPSQSSAWPAAGYFPTQMLPAGGAVNPAAWSYQSTEFNLSQATVSMNVNGQNIPLAAPAVADNFPVIGQPDSALYWQPSALAFPSGGGEKDVNVTISGVTDFSGSAKPDISYTVRLFNAGTIPSTDVPAPATCDGAQNSRLSISGTGSNVHFGSGIAMQTVPGSGAGCLQYSLSVVNGQLVIMGTNDVSALWGVPSAGAYISIQSDGNVVEYSASGQPLFASGTRVGDGAGNYLALQTDGNLVVYPGGGSGGVSIMSVQG